MNSLMMGTCAVSMDEPCFSLAEMDLMPPTFREHHRYRILHVVRNDHLAEMRIDLGPATLFKDVQPLRVIGGVIDERTGCGEILHTVGELIDIAEFLKREALPQPEGGITDWGKARLEHADRRWRRRNGRRQFGHDKIGRR